MNSRLYIGNLSPEICEADLQALFSQAGAVVEVQIMRDPVTQQSRGFAFVTMATSESAAAALNNFHSHRLGGRYITVTEARPPQEPKGLMSEGFGVGAPSPFRPVAKPSKSRRPHRGRKH